MGFNKVDKDMAEGDKVPDRDVTEDRDEDCIEDQDVDDDSAWGLVTRTFRAFLAIVIEQPLGPMTMAT